MNDFCVYQHIRDDNNTIFYIGIGKKRRPYDRKGRNQHWFNIVNKTTYKIEILFFNLSHQDAKEKEIELIKKYGRIDLKNGILCNKTDGGDGRVNAIVTRKNKILLSTLFKGKTRDKEIGNKISNSLKGKTLSKTHKEKISNTLTGRESLQKGYIRSTESKSNISTGHSKYLILVFEDDLLIGEFCNTVDAAKHLKISNNISKCFNNKLKHIDGYTFVRLPNE